jgi:hypothetical protein
MEPKIRIYCIYSVKLEWRPRRGGTVLASCYSLSSRSITMFLVIPRAAFFISFILASNKGNEPRRITILENGFVPSLSHVIILLGIKRCFSCKSKKKKIISSRSHFGSLKCLAIYFVHDTLTWCLMTKLKDGLVSRIFEL